ncbi:pectin lyase-like protein, partial [Aureobasidium melanogenum]
MGSLRTKAATTLSSAEACSVSGVETQGAVESNRRNIVTQVLARSSIVDSVDNVDADNFLTSARRCSRALNSTDHITNRGSGPILKADIVEVELASVASAAHPVIRSALGRGIDTGIVVKDEIEECDVGSVTQTTATTVRRITSRDTSLDVGAISHVVGADVASSDIFDDFESVVVLTNAANCDTKTHIEVTVFNQDVGAVGFQGDGIISVSDVPATEGDVVCVDCVRAVDVFEKNVFAVNDGHGPHLRVHETGTQEGAIFGSSDGNLVRSARATPKAIESSISMTIPIDVLSTKQPSRGLVLVANRQRMVEPVRNVGIPEK